MTEKNVWPVMKRTKMMWTIVLVETIVLVRSVNFVFFKFVIISYTIILKLAFVKIIYQNMNLAGCPCESFDCDSLNEIAESCKDPASNKNYQFCYDEQKTSMDQCLEKCKTPDCHLNCAATFEKQLQRCPCAKECPCKIFFSQNIY